MRNRHYFGRRRKRRPATLVLLSLVAAGAGWWLWPAGEAEPLPGDADATRVAFVPGETRPSLQSDRPEIQPVVPPRADIVEKGAADPDVPANRSTSPTQPAAAVEGRVTQLVKSGRTALSEGQLLTARAQLNEAFVLGLSRSEAAGVRADLVKLADETVFSRRIIPGDPFAEKHVVVAGDTLARIAAKYKVPDDLLASVNGIVRKDLIQLGQTLKVVNGPFHVVVNCESFTMNVFLGDGAGRVLVRQFPVGLGQDDGTPRGTWKVKNKLVNPTYYPPRGGKIVSSDDPENPLGERWIGLEGVAGDAVGQQRYGIHGTIEPHSIGQNASLGCVRMHNADVEALYDFLVVGHSTVTIE
jgi:hypothetical protein